MIKALVDKKTSDTLWGEAPVGGSDAIWPSDAIWRFRSGSALAQVMACCLLAPSHYLNQCWLTISEGNHLRAISQKIPLISINEINWKITYIKFHSNLTGANELSPCSAMPTISGIKYDADETSSNHRQEDDLKMLAGVSGTHRHSGGFVRNALWCL